MSQSQAKHLAIRPAFPALALEPLKVSPTIRGQTFWFAFIALGLPKLRPEHLWRALAR
jgi:hypothetical protein